jgi:hypothetical protein
MNLIDPQTVLSEASHDMIEESLPKILQACKNLPKNSQNGLRYKKTTNTLNDARSILLERMPILCNQYWFCTFWLEPQNGYMLFSAL